MHSTIQNKFIKGKLSEFIVKQVKGGKTRFLTFTAFALGLMFIGMFIFSRLHTINDAASVRLASAFTFFSRGDQKKGFALINETISHFSKTPAAYQARLIKADILTVMHKYDEALKILTKILDNGTPDIIKPLASSRIIYVYDSQKNYFDAIIASKEFINKYPDHFLTGDIHLNLAEYYILTGSKDNAASVFTDVLVKFPATYEAETAQNRLNQLK
ncbi:MAG: tetratricopeptide repeat protein [Endomicrobium sp.]|jgi:predicted negative regulator of RcsB-dependent stress response|nr:tetratricopeptide repeat protein [Endomicrobium sp.]